MSGERTPRSIESEQVRCACAAVLIQTNSHEDGCASDQARWDDPEYVADWELRTRPDVPTEATP